MTIEERYELVRGNIIESCNACGRHPDEVKLIAVTKTRTPEEINRVIRCGAGIIGENRVQELNEKYDDIDKGVEIHLIGQLQTNKVKQVLGKVDLIHSLDRVSLAQQIEKSCSMGGFDPVKALIEINIGNESTKSGILSDNLTEFLDILADFRYIKPIGLMTVAPALANEYELNVYFEKMYKLLEMGKSKLGDDFCELSMGMSRDYNIAIRQGSTMVRVGTALFGERIYK